MESKLEEFYKRLTKGPAFLLLGQDYLRLEMGHDPFLTEIIRKYNHNVTGTSSYYELLR